MSQCLVTRIDEAPFDYDEVNRFLGSQPELLDVYQENVFGIAHGVRARVSFENEPTDLSYDKNSSSIVISTGNMAGYEIPFRLQQYFPDLELALVDADGNWAVALKKCANWEEVRDKVENSSEFVWPPS